MKIILSFFVFASLIVSGQKKNGELTNAQLHKTRQVKPRGMIAASETTTIQHQIFALTEAMYHDIVSPPAAARFYAYSILTGYEILTQLNKSTPSIKEVLNDYPSIEAGPVAGYINYELAVMYGILETGKNLIPSGNMIADKQNQLIKTFKGNRFSKKILDSSISFAEKISDHIINYARSDGYFKLSTFERYTPDESEGMWKPTAPEYMAAAEPHWNTIRLFFLDSAKQFTTGSSEKFDRDSSSAFYKLAREVYEVSNKLSDDQMQIANFWDCNPFAVQFQGHMSIGLKKISPAGHWISITGIVSKQKKMNFSKTLLLHTLVALTIHDAFISCWDEKYRSNRLRPETVINQYFDPDWKPLLQSPPFPEYPSGHSVISLAAAEVLSYFLGPEHSFIDTTESYIGLPPRKFSSFRQAAQEACISRLYGGIHFRDAIERGAEQGRMIGEFVIGKVKGIMNSEL